MANSWGKNSIIEWHDKKRHLGMALSFTHYYLVSNPEWTKLYVRTGFLSVHEEEINIYRIYDISLTRSLGERLCGVGSIVLYSKDESTPTLVLRHIANPARVRNLLASKIEEEKAKRGFRVAEFN